MTLVLPGVGGGGGRQIRGQRSLFMSCSVAVRAHHPEIYHVADWSRPPPTSVQSARGQGVRGAWSIDPTARQGGPGPRSDV